MTDKQKKASATGAKTLGICSFFWQYGSRFPMVRVFSSKMLSTRLKSAALN